MKHPTLIYSVLMLKWFQCFTTQFFKCTKRTQISSCALLVCLCSQHGCDLRLFPVFGTARIVYRAGSMQLSVCLSRPAGLLLWARQAGERSTAAEAPGECGQCHVVSVRRCSWTKTCLNYLLRFWSDGRLSTRRYTHLLLSAATAAVDRRDR